jgi:hypothetical protein
MDTNNNRCQRYLLMVVDRNQQFDKTIYFYFRRVRVLNRGF